MEVHNGEQTSFWYDNWSTLGVLYNLTGPRGFIDTGIPAYYTLRQAATSSRRRRFRTEILTQIGAALDQYRDCQDTTSDRVLWKQSTDVYKPVFHSALTLELIRDHRAKVDWHYGVWFKHHTPKFSFMVWLALQNRLSTGDKLVQWNTQVSSVCVLCSSSMETLQHLFFECTYSKQIWTDLGKGLFQRDFSISWDHIILKIGAKSHDIVQAFLQRYVFQSAVHRIWRERNERRHGSTPCSAQLLSREVDRSVRNRCSSIRLQGDVRYEEALIRWFASRP